MLHHLLRLVCVIRMVLPFVGDDNATLSINASHDNSRRSRFVLCFTIACHINVGTTNPNLTDGDRPPLPILMVIIFLMYMKICLVNG